MATLRDISCLSIMLISKIMYTMTQAALQEIMPKNTTTTGKYRYFTTALVLWHKPVFDHKPYIMAMFIAIW